MITRRRARTQAAVAPSPPPTENTSNNASMPQPSSAPMQLRSANTPRSVPDKENTGSTSRNSQRAENFNTNGRHFLATLGTETGKMIEVAEAQGYDVFNVAGDGNCAIYSILGVLNTTRQLDPLIDELQNCRRDSTHAAKLIRQTAAQRTTDSGASNNLTSPGTIEADAFQVLLEWFPMEVVVSANHTAKFLSAEGTKPAAFLFCVEGHCLFAIQQGKPICQLEKYLDDFPAWKVTAAEFTEQCRHRSQGANLACSRPWKSYVLGHCPCAVCVVKRPGPISTRTTPKTSRTPTKSPANEARSDTPPARTSATTTTTPPTLMTKSDTTPMVTPITATKGATISMTTPTMATKGDTISTTTPTMATNGDVTSTTNSAKIEPTPTRTPTNTPKIAPTPTRTPRTPTPKDKRTKSTRLKRATDNLDAFAQLTAFPGNDDAFVRCFCGHQLGTDLDIVRHFHRHHPRFSVMTLVDHLDLVICPDCQTIIPFKNKPVGAQISDLDISHDCPTPVIGTDEGLRATQSLLSQLRAWVALDDVPNLSDADKQERQILGLYRIFTDKPLGPIKPSTSSLDTDQVLLNLRSGHSTKAARVASSSALADPTEAAFREKFPLQRDRADFPEFDPVDFPEISEDEVNKFIDSRTTLTAKGPDGSSLLQLADIAKKAKDGPEVLAKVLTFIHLNQHLFSNELRLAMNSVRSVCLTKPNGDFRPIGVGKALWRLYQGIIMARNSSAINAALNADNHTLRPNGNSNIVSLVQRFLSLGGCALFTDRSNAFNRTSVADASDFFARKGLNEVAHLAKTNEYHKVIHQALGTLLTGHIPQGSSIGSACMAMVMDVHLAQLRAQDEGVILSHTDDITFLGWDERRQLQTADQADESLSTAGIPENVNKRMIWNDKSTQVAKTMGAFVGTDEQIIEPLAKAIDDIIKEIQEFVDKVASYRLEDAPIRHAAFRALRTNYIPRLIYLMQHHPAHVTHPLLQRVDSVIVDSVGKILCLTPQETAERLTQLQLPTNRGGFGYTSLAETVYLQRFGTLVRSLPYVSDALARLDCEFDCVFPELDVLIDRLTRQLCDPDTALCTKMNTLRALNNRKISPSPELFKAFRSLQQELTTKYVDRKHTEWKASFPPDNLDQQERLHSISAKEAGRPLNVVTAYRPNHLNDTEFIAFARHRLLIPAITGNKIYCVDSHTEIDPHLDHAVCCQSRGRGVMHTYVKNAVYHVAKDLSRYRRKMVTMEPAIAQYLNPAVESNKNDKSIDGLKQRRGDISLESVSLESHHERTKTIIDVRHCSMSKTLKSSADIGKTVKDGEKDKHDFYDKNFIFPHGTTMVPFVIDTYGRWGDKAHEWLEKECKDAAGNDNKLYNELVSRSREVISLAHARGIGKTLERCINRCIHPENYHQACTRGDGVLAA